MVKEVMGINKFLKNFNSEDERKMVNERETHTLSTKEKLKQNTKRNPSKIKERKMYKIKRLLEAFSIIKVRHLRWADSKF